LCPASIDDIRNTIDGSQIIAEYNSSGTLVRNFIYGLGIDEPIMMIVVDGQTETQYYYFDGLGSILRSGPFLEKD
jgi:hypothetical protein